MPPIPLTALPEINACLNALSAVFLAAGFTFIKLRKVRAHKACMITAFCVSTVFLASYLYYHAHAGIVYFKRHGFIRPVYFTLLTTHTILAAAVPVLAIITLSYALRNRFDRHKRIAVYTFPIWLYVSVTGVAVYWMLFR